jgi:hypothetical protein
MILLASRLNLTLSDSIPTGIADDYVYITTTFEPSRPQVLVTDGKASYDPLSPQGLCIHRYVIPILRISFIVHLIPDTVINL